MRLSVIIPTHDRPDVLRDCLSTLAAQELDPPSMEVVVVDDGSRADIGGVVAEVAAGSRFSMRCERQPLGGLNVARNRGVSVSDGEVIAFLDDDTLVSPGWASAVLDAFADDGCAAAGGRVDLRLEGPEPPWMAEWRCYLAEYDLGSEPRRLGDADPVPVGANCAVRRSVFDRAGGFRAGIDRLGTSLVSNGDTEFFRRLRAGGESLRYVPAASVVHRVPAHRLTLDYFLQRHRAQGVSDELLLRLEGHHGSIGHRVGIAREVAKAAMELAADRLLRRDAVRTRLLLNYWTARLRAVGLQPPQPDAGPAPRG